MRYFYISFVFRFKYPKFPSVKTIIAQPNKCDEDYEVGQVRLDKVRKLLMDKEVMDNIKEEHPLNEDASEEEYIKMREERIRALLVVAGVDFNEYHRYLAMNKKGVEVVLQRDIEEVNINTYNVRWLELWNANLDIQPVADFFAVITYIIEYAFKPEPQEIEMRKALEAVKDQSMGERMKMIAQAFQDTRQMGEAEALYKLLPSLEMTNSNVKKQWVCLSREEERTTRARKANPEDIKAGRATFQLEGVEGQWMEQWDMRSKYCRRPSELAHLTFSQWARMMEATNGCKKVDEEESGDLEEFAEDDMEVEEENQVRDKPWYQPFHKVMICTHQCCTDQAKEGCEGICCQAKPRRNKLKRVSKKLERKMDLPEVVALSDIHCGEPKFMKKRRVPAALRFFKHKKDTNPIKFFLQELILYVPFGLEENGDTKNLLQEPDDQIVILYDKYSQHIKEVKSQVLPFLEDVTEERFYVEEVRRQMDVEEMGLEIAAGKELDNMEAMDAEVIVNFYTYFGTIFMGISFKNTMYIKYG